MKKVGIALFIFIAIVAGTLFWLRNNLDGLVREAIAKYGSEMTQAKVTVGSVKIDAVNAEGVISDFVVGNPKGFNTPYALRVKEFRVALDPASITGDVITVKKLPLSRLKLFMKKVIARPIMM